MEQEQSWEMREGNGKIKKQVRNKTSTHFWEKWEIWLFTLRLIKDTACSGSVRDFDWWIAKNSSGGEGLSFLSFFVFPSE